MTAQRAAPAAPEQPDTGWHWSRLVLVIIPVAQLMFLLDATIVNVALPSIQRSLGFSGSGLEWVVTAYSVTFGGLLLLGGRAGDILGLRRVFVAGLVIFTAASLLGGFAPTQWWLLVCRAAQGLGAAAASPAALSLIATTFAEGPRRNRALGIYTAIAGVGGPVGLVAGGFITTYMSWRWIMFVNVPVGAALIALAPRVLAASGDRRAGRRAGFDLPGALTGTLGVTLLVYGFISAATDAHGVSHWTDLSVIITVVAAVVLLAAFIMIESRRPDPLVPLRFFANRQRSGTYFVLTLSSTAMFGVYFFLTLYLQRVWGYSALRTAVVYVPLSLILMASTNLGSRIVAKTGPRILILTGFGSAAAGLGWLSQIQHSGGFVTGFLFPTLITYFGFGLTAVPLTMIALTGVAQQDSGLASGLFNTARQVGGAVGLAVLGTVAWANVAAAASRLSAASPGGSTPASATRIADLALAVGAGQGFAVASGVTVAALVVAAIAIGRRAR